MPPRRPPAEALSRCSGPFRAIAREVLLLREFLPPAVPDLSPGAVARWVAVRPAGCGFPSPDLPYREARSLFAHSGDVRSAILASKYSSRPFPSRAVARRLAEALRGPWRDLFPDGPPPTIVPVPVHPLKYFRRGFNLPALVGAELARLLHWPCDPLALARRRDGLPQAGLPRRERLRNMEGAFLPRKGKAAPARVLLLDDVFTTGATARSAASALKCAGADHIVVVTIARAVP